MDIYTLGLLEIYLPKRGLNRDTLGTVTRRGKEEFTRKAIKAFNEEKKKQAKMIVPITNIGFSANGASPGQFMKWIKSLVAHELGHSKIGSYKVDDYNSLRNQLITK